MSRLFSHPPYAEDQPLARTFLTFHVLTRAIATGSILGSAFVGIAQLMPSQRRPPSQFRQRLLRASATGTLVTIAITEVGLFFRMLGREEIEWQDRSWRLLESATQLRIDDLTYLGMLAGPAALVATYGAGADPVALLGASSLGGGVALLTYSFWRYGIRRLFRSD